MSAPVERDVMVSLLNDLGKSLAMADKLKPEHLSVPHIRWMYKKHSYFVKKYNDLPTISFFKTELAREKKLGKEEKERYERLIRKILRKKIGKGVREYALDEINRFIGKTQVMIQIEKSLDKLEAGELEEAIGELNSTTKIRLAERDYEISNWAAGWRERQRIRKLWKTDPSATGVVRFPWRTLNKYIQGIQPKEVATIASTTNVGKSIALMFAGRHAFIDGKKVLHIEVEDSKELIERRYDSSILGVPSDALKTYSLSKFERKKLNQKVELIRHVMGENLVIAKCYPRKTSIITIDRIIHQLVQDGWGKPDLVIIDHADVMAPSDKQEQYRLDQSVVYWDLNTFADIQCIPILTATQVSKGFKGKKAIAEGLSEAYDKARILNIVLTLNQLDESSPEMILYVAKNRDGKKGMEIPLIAKFNVMRLVEARYATPHS